MREVEYIEVCEGAEDTALDANEPVAGEPEAV